MADMRYTRREFIGAALAGAAAGALPQIAQAQFFDAPFVPTPQVIVDEMLRLANVGTDDIVYDLGSGDGRIPITAARKFGARGVGIELADHLIFQSEASAQQAKVADRVQFLQQDLFKADYSKATVITFYLLPGMMKRLRDHMLKLAPGTRLVAHDFDFEEWRPDRKVTIRKNLFLWVVPASVGGRWRVRTGVPGGEQTFEMELRQRFQELDGYARFEKLPGGLWEPKITGERVSFVVVDSRDRDDEAAMHFEGRVAGAGMSGELVRGAGSEAQRFRWQASRL
jgi:SAM-dependent methyltransferase